MLLKYCSVKPVFECRCCTLQPPKTQNHGATVPFRSSSLCNCFLPKKSFSSGNKWRSHDTRSGLYRRCFQNYPTLVSEVLSVFLSRPSIVVYQKKPLRAVPHLLFWIAHRNLCSMNAPRESNLSGHKKPSPSIS